MNTIDLRRAYELLYDALDDVKELNGQPYDDTEDFGGGQQRKKAKKELAQTGRMLLHLADALTEAASLVRAQYWAGKGY